MTKRRFAIRDCGLCLAGLCIGVFPAASAYAQAQVQTPAIPEEKIFPSRVAPLTEVIKQAEGDHRPQTSEGAVQILDWLLYGNIGVGSAYDSNLAGSSSHAKSASGIRLDPSLIALRDTGIHRTLLYGIGDIRFYPDESVTTFNNTRVGLEQTWEVQRDFKVRAQGEFGADNEISWLASDGGVGVPDEPIEYTTGFGSVSAEKGFGRFFVGVGGSIEQTDYHDVEDEFGNTIDEDYRDGIDYVASTRFGYHISPITYIYTQPTFTWRRYDKDSNLNSDGQRVVAGIGTERISLFSGEVYGGFYNEDFEDPTLGVVDGPVFGGRVSWFPTRTVTLTSRLDHSFNTSDYEIGSLGPASITEDYVAALNADWAVRRAVTLRAGVQLTNADFLGSPRQDDITELSLGGTYYFRERLGISVKYTHVDRDSNLEGASYTRDFFSIGGDTKF